MSETRHLVRLKWPGPGAFENPEALKRALAEGADRVESLLGKGASKGGAGGLPGSIGRHLGGLLGRLVGRGRPNYPAPMPTLTGGPGDPGKFEWDDSPRPSGDRASALSREGVGAWRVDSESAAMTALVDSATDLVRFDQEDRGFAFPPPQSGDVNGAALDPPASQRDRIGVDTRVHARTTGKGIRVAVIDSGLDRSHDEFTDLDLDKQACWSWYRPHSPEQGKYAAIPVLPGHEFATRHYHGTAVAGLVAGRTSGMAPESTLMVHNVFYARPSEETQRLGWRDAQGVWHQPDATLISVEGALMYALATLPDIIVLSLGTKGYDPCFEEEISTVARRWPGVLVVAAAGNSRPGTHLSPGDYREVLTVGAVDLEGQFWNQTSGARLNPGGGAPAETSYVKPDLYALGVDLDVPVPEAVAPSGYLRRSGTSFAAPIVAGVAALVMSWYRGRGKTITATEVREHLLATADDVTVPEALGINAKRLNASRAIDSLKSSVPT